MPYTPLRKRSSSRSVGSTRGDGSTAVGTSSRGEGSAARSPRSSYEPSPLVPLLEGADPLLREAALHWITTFERGTAPYATHTAVEPDGLCLRFEQGLRGEIATRSRVPLSMELAPEVRAVPRVEEDGAVVVAVEGVSFVPLDGVLEIFPQLVTRWEAKEKDVGAPLTLPQRLKVAWEWWQEHKEEYADTKLWRIVMTMVSSRYAHAFPKTAAQEMLLGSLCHESRNLTHLRFSLWEARKPQVHLFYDPPPCEAGPDAAPDSIEVLKGAVALEIVRPLFHNPLHRSAGDKFFRSAFNFGQATFAHAVLREKWSTMKGADPEAVAKLFQASEVEGGATTSDVWLHGAAAWQRNDCTYQMAGPNGRIKWWPLGAP